MSLAEYFSYLPFGKYAFYIWLSYIISIIVIVTLFVHAALINKNTTAQLRIKYLIKNDKTAK